LEREREGNLCATADWRERDRAVSVLQLIGEREREGEDNYVLQLIGEKETGKFVCYS